MLQLPHPRGVMAVVRIWPGVWAAKSGDSFGGFISEEITPLIGEDRENFLVIGCLLGMPLLLRLADFPRARFEVR